MKILNNKIYYHNKINLFILRRLKKLQTKFIMRSIKIQNLILNYFRIFLCGSNINKNIIS